MIIIDLCLVGLCLSKTLCHILNNSNAFFCHALFQFCLMFINFFFVANQSWKIKHSNSKWLTVFFSLLCDNFLSNQKSYPQNTFARAFSWLISDCIVSVSRIRAWLGNLWRTQSILHRKDFIQSKVS